MTPRRERLWFGLIVAVILLLLLMATCSGDFGCYMLKSLFHGGPVD